MSLHSSSSVNGEGSTPKDTLDKSALRKRHIPSYYERELMDKLQRLRQGSMSVEEYRQQMELLLLRAGLREEERTSIARFLSRLNMEVRDKVELLSYKDLDELVQLCIRVEQQLKIKSSLKSCGFHSYPRSLRNFGGCTFTTQGR